MQKFTIVAFNTKTGEAMTGLAESHCDGCALRDFMSAITDSPESVVFIGVFEGHLFNRFPEIEKRMMENAEKHGAALAPYGREERAEGALGGGVKMTDGIVNPEKDSDVHH